MSSDTPSDTSSHSPRKRRMSAPPMNFHDLSDLNGKRFYSRTNESEALFMDPKDMAEFSSFECVKNEKSTRVFLGVDKVLKTYSYLVDVSKIVANMDLARTKVPVPRVYRYGYSGNCAYILMERAQGYTMSAVLRHRMSGVPDKVSVQIRKIVEDLASLGLCHNDLKPRNIMVNRRWEIESIIDWDNCTPLIHGGEYTKRVVWAEKHNPLLITDAWDVLFLSASVDKVGEELLIEQLDHFWSFTAPLRGTGSGESFGPQAALSVPWLERCKKYKALRDVAEKR
ncbi:hypothetical protein V5O48_012533 [Marasmius crinis-equi]|uniref:Aminoglycoside phosphotransferase domain-containing protein n=1 Tax=Marasmius crinis-equi TaxID=585013 RepID=A0ABR3F358_9AGAR